MSEIVVQLRITPSIIEVSKGLLKESGDPMENQAHRLVHNRFSRQNRIGLPERIGECPGQGIKEQY